MNKRAVILFALLFADPALADCNALGQQGHNLDRQLEATIQQYQTVVTAAASSSDRPNMYAKAIEANNKLLGAFNSYVELLERSQSEGCFGQQAAAWTTILNKLRSRREEFKEEREVLLKAVPVVQADKNNKTTQGKTSSEFLTEKLDAQFEAMNKVAPIDVDSKTQLTRVERTGKVITYSYEVRIPQASWTPQMRDQLVRSTSEKTCGDKGTRTLLGLGYEFRFMNLDSTGLLVSSALVTSEKCAQLTAQQLRELGAK
jgi:hypothetical protein